MMNCCSCVLIVAWISGSFFSRFISASIVIVRPENLTISEGETLSINCSTANATNVTGLNFTWSKVGEGSVLEQSSQLTIVDVNRTDEGQYNCIATNGTVAWTVVATVTVFYPPEILSHSKNLTVNESFETNLICNASGNPSPRILWSLPNGSSIVLRKKKFLTFKSTSKSQHGRYSCQAFNPVGNSTFSPVIYLNVQYPPQLVYSTRNLTVNESFETNLFCNASGNPSPSIQWSLPNGSRVVLANNQFITFRNTSKMQHGRYSCKAINHLGNSSTTVMYLNVHYKPRLNRTGRAAIIDSWLHHNSALTCQAEGNPTPKITWSKDRNEILNGSISASIFVIPSDDKDFGNYTCTASNAVGTDVLYVEVVRTAFPPAAPVILNKEKQLNNRSFTLRWSRAVDNGRPILRYVVFYRELHVSEWKQKDASTNLNYTLTLKWAKTYEFTVMAENDQGQSNNSKKENFTVIPEPTMPTAKATVSSTAISDSKSKKLMYGAAAGGAILLLVVIIITVVCCVKRRLKTDGQLVLANWTELQSYSPRRSAKTSPTIASTNNYNAMPHPRVPNRNESGQKKVNHVHLNSAQDIIYSNVSCLEEEIPHWEFPREQVHIQKYVGKGAFCVVAQAFVEGLGTVAVKIPKDKAPETNKKDLLAEYELMKQLQSHPNVIRLMGAVTLSDPIMVMFEYIPYGDLLGFLRKSRGLNDNYYKDPDIKPSSSLTSEQLLKFAREIADGMAFLAANKIIHRDLAARNVLVGEEETCKITDFGMARDVQNDDIYRKRTKGRLPVKWTAVESLLYGYCTTQSDVWSYGIVLYEIFTIGGRPYPNIQAHRIPYMIKDNYRMPKPVHLDEEIYALMCECWSNEPDRRPTFESISRIIKRLERCHKEIIYMNVYDDQLYGNVEDWD